MFALVAVLWVLSAFSLVLTAFNMALWRRAVREAGAAPGAVSILIPARNEEENLPECLEAAIGQGETVREILIYNDHSDDGTSDVIARFAGQDDRVRAIETAELPEGWCGKNFACAKLAEAAAGEWLLYIDADARLASNAAARLVRTAQERKCTFLGAWPKVAMKGFWERLVMPLLNFSVFTLYPAPAAEWRKKDPSFGLGHGACLLMERAAYDRVGGHTAVKGELFEDTLLARLWREKGEYSLCVDGQSVVKVRMYDSLAGIWDGFTKNFYPAFKSDAGFFGYIGFHFIAFLLPFLLLPLLAFPGGYGLAALGAAINVLAIRGLMAVRFSYPMWSVLLHPIAQAILLAIALRSRSRYRSAAGVSWKGRSYSKDSQERAKP